jgi:hypothetical protein
MTKLAAVIAGSPKIAVTVGTAGELRREESVSTEAWRDRLGLTGMLHWLPLLGVVLKEILIFGKPIDVHYM